jgi:glycosyltransferase involved in cell wall biosynthesis
MGGAEVFTYENAKRWVKKGHEVSIFTSEFQDCKKNEIIDGIEVVRSGGKYSVYRNAKKHYNNYFRKKKYDVVIDEINTRPFLTPKFVNNNEKIIGLIHQLAREYWLYETSFPINYLGFYFLEKWWLRKYVKIPTLTVSESTKKDLIDLGFRRVFIVPEGLNFEPLSEIPEKSENPIISYVGRLNRAKRPKHAIEAFKFVKKKIPSAKLWIIGDGYLLPELRKIAPEDVSFFTNLSNQERRNLIKQTWVIVNPSVREGFGLNMIEGNALGTTSVAYAVPGLVDSVVSGKTGILVEPGNINDLAASIIKIIENKVLRRRLEKEALIYSKQFTWDKSAQSIISRIEGLLEVG